jgi:nitrogen PTS system EIIA component
MQPTASDAVPPMSALIRAGGVFYDIEGYSRQDVLRALVGYLPLPPNHDRDALIAALEAREAKGSTGIGAGIAIPHVRDSAVLRVDHPFVSLCLLRRPVDFRAIDAKPVHALFMVVSPSTRTHLKILGKIGRILRDATLTELLRRRAPSDEIIRRVEVLDSF